MRITIVAVGRLKSGSELHILDDYLQRAGKTGGQFGLGPFGVVEIDERKAIGKQAQAAALKNALPQNCKVVAMDERGVQFSSPQFASRLADWRDDGTRDVACVIGGADGLDAEFAKNADVMLSFGKMVWPHMLARVMLSEQLYRTTSIVANLPYHRT